jgi:hypothetical protein
LTNVELLGACPYTQPLKSATGGFAPVVKDDPLVVDPNPEVAENPLEVDVENPLEVVVEKPLDVDVENPLEVEGDVEKPLEVDVENPLEVDVENPLEVDVENPLEVVVENPLEVDGTPVPVVGIPVVGLTNPEMFGSGTKLPSSVSAQK